LGQLFRYVWKRWYVLVLAGLLGGLAGIGIVWMQPPVYEARGSFAIDEKNAGLGGALGFAAELGFNFGGTGRDVFSGENIVYIMHSRRMIEQVLLSADSAGGRQFTLADWYIQFVKGKGKPVPGYMPVFPVGRDRSTFTYQQDSILSGLQQSISKDRLFVGKPDKKFNIYEVAFRSPNERFSKVFAERLMAAAGDYYAALRSSRSKRNFEILEERVAAMRGRASSAIQQDAAQKDANVNPAFAKASARSAEKQIDLSAYGRAYEELFRNLELARYQYLNDVPFIQVIDAPSFPIKNKKMGRLKGGIIGGFLFGSAALLILALSCFLPRKKEMLS
jgi:uncharacterized protein involved in exopolysaccharide biosynthesis